MVCGSGQKNESARAWLTPANKLCCLNAAEYILSGIEFDRQCTCGQPQVTFRFPELLYGKHRTGVAAIREPACVNRYLEVRSFFRLDLRLSAL